MPFYGKGPILSQNKPMKPIAPASSPVRRWASLEQDVTPQPSFASSCLQHPVFGELFRLEICKTSETVRAMDAPIKEFGIVADGCLKGSRYTIDGNELCNTYFEAGDVFPELLYFTGNKVYTYNLVAVKKTTIMWIETQFFELMLKTDNQLMYRFMLYMSKRGLKNQMLLNCLRYQTIRERVAFWLLWMDDVAQGNLIELPSSQGMWANELRVSRSSLNQELKRMEHLGHFRIDGHKLQVLDRAALEELL